MFKCQKKNLNRLEIKTYFIPSAENIVSKSDYGNIQKYQEKK